MHRPRPGRDAMAELGQTTPVGPSRGAGKPETVDVRDDRLLPWRRVRDITGISRTTAWRMQQTGDFPNPVPVSAKRVGWWESELTAWKARRRFASGERPTPCIPAKPSRTSAQKPEARPANVDVIPVEAATVELIRSAKTSTQRRMRTKASSPDQIDFGF